MASTIVLTVAAGLIGTLFGRVTSRGLVRRLENLERISEAWGQGDFLATVDGTSPDEIGQLARRMSQMAGQVQDLLQARQTGIEVSLALHGEHTIPPELYHYISPNLL